VAAAGFARTARAVQVLDYERAKWDMSCRTHG
jgi:hypothetical protein